jgi:hypothetical protein
MVPSGYRWYRNQKAAERVQGVNKRGSPPERKGMTMAYTLTLHERHLDLIRDLLEERLEDVENDIEHYNEHPEELNSGVEAGEEPVSIEDYEQYRDEIQSLLSLITDTSEE